MREPVYEVFARKTRDEPLRHIGHLNAPNPELARVFAWKTYDEQHWFEMCVVPRASILAVNLEEGPFAREVAGAVPVPSGGAGSYGGDE